MKEKIAYIGIDPGAVGVVTLLIENEFHFFNMPYHKVETGEFTKTGKPKTINKFHNEGLADLVFELHLLTRNYRVIGAIEEVTGRNGWSAQNSFNFGYKAGLQMMILIMLRAEIELVRPQKWQSVMYNGYEKIMVPSQSGKTMVPDAKATSRMVAKDLYPNIDFRKSEKAKNDDDNRIDSFLICLYKKRKHEKQLK